MAYTTVRVQVYDRGIQAHFEPGGAVNRDANSVGDTAVRSSKAELVPDHGLRTGRLRASVHKVGRGIMGRFTYIVTVAADAPYAMFVEKGTGDLVMSKGMVRALKPGPGHPRTTVLKGPRVLKGQRGIHFMRNGMNASLVDHGYGPLPNE